MQNLACPFCHKPNRAGAKHCQSCGHALPPHAPLPPIHSSTCPRCHAALRAGATFCGVCGHRLVSPVINPPPRPGATQRLNLPTLTVRFPGGRIQMFDLSEGATTLGADAGNTIALPLPFVSRQHLQFHLTPAGVTVTELGSTNGTTLNGRLLPPHQPSPLQAGDTLRIGDAVGNSLSLVLQTGEAPPIRTLPVGNLDLQNITGPLVIGRAPTSTLPLNHPAISQRHAMLGRTTGGQLWIRDLGSTNGTFLNGQRISQQTPIREGDVIQIGPFKLVYSSQKSALTSMLVTGHRLDALDLSLRVADGKRILNQISLSIAPGEFVALVGGSGAGKSTLLRALNGYVPANEGRMLVDGELLYPNLGLYRTQMGYVPQDDIIHRELPVRVALRYAARLRLPDASGAEIESRIDKVLQTVEMTAHAEKPVHVLSGGQRKRVSIAVELLAEPTLFFLDEPTSGLDPGLEKKMMEDLSHLADEGRTVVLVTHATANIEKCNHVAFLSQGKLAYYGPPREAPKFFSVPENDFAGIYLRLSLPVDPDNAQGLQALPAEIQPYLPAVLTPPLPVAPARAPALGDDLKALVRDLKAGFSLKPKKAKKRFIEAGQLWAEHYKRSPQRQKFVADRQRNLSAGQGGGVQKIPPARDSSLRQMWVLARRHFDLIRYDVRTLFILLLMMPFLGGLFMAVSGKYDFTGYDLTAGDVTRLLQAKLVCEPRELGDREDPQAILNLDCAEEEEIEARLGAANADPKHDLWDNVDKSQTYMPMQAAQTLVTMMGLALTQAGTFIAIYEIVKEEAIFKRERAINLKVGAYVLAKVLVLALFGVYQVAAMLAIIGFKVKLDFNGVFMDPGWLELFLTLSLAVLASILFGLFLSSIMPNQDVVAYVILFQLFVQIILSGAMFPLPDEADPVARVTISSWTMDAMGSVVDIEGLNNEGQTCVLKESTYTNPLDGQEVTELLLNCDAAKQDDLPLDYEHTQDHLMYNWLGLLGHSFLWGALTVIAQARKK